MEMEIICISSDDETSSQKENKKTKLDNTSLTCKKVENFSNDEKIEKNNLKRKMLMTDSEEETQNRMEKKKKLNTNQDVCMTKAKIMSQPNEYHISDEPNCSVQSNKDLEIIIEKPKLVVKGKKKISYVAHDVFPLFISLCLQRSKDNDKDDMQKIINKLKRRYEKLDVEYTSSEHFVSFLNEKRASIMYNDETIYVHIQDVMNEMKKRSRKKSRSLSSNETNYAIPSTSYAANNLLINNTTNSVDEDKHEENLENVNSEKRSKIKLVLQTMEKCEGKIKRLEQAEVDFDEEDDMTYIKLETYKQRMVELYTKYCELTGENADAGRVYLRPKHICSTKIVAVDQAITNFINSKITQRNQAKKAAVLTDDVIFPDYRDILQCVGRCNDKRNLGLDRRKQKELAKKAFLELGEFLQRARRTDYWDTFSLYLENTEEDPALKDKELAMKLAKNRSEGEKRLTAVFEKYAKKQVEIKELNEIEIASEDEQEEDEEENIVYGKNKTNDDLLVTSLSEEDSDNEKDINEKVKDKRLLVEDGTSNINTINIYQNKDKVMSNKTILVTKQQKHEIDKIKTPMKENNNTVVPQNENQTTSEKTIHKACNSNPIAKYIVDKDIETLEDSLPTCSTANGATNIKGIEEDLPEVITEDMTKVITDPVIEMVTEDAIDVIAGAVVKQRTEDVPVVMLAGDETEVIKDMADVILTENQREEEKKPLLRVRSFAKPPTTWEVDNRQKIKIGKKKLSKVTNKHKEVIDLTNEPVNKPSITNKTTPVTKCTIQLGNKVLPVVKRLLIPSKRNVISVQNITNNYLKVNTQKGQIITPVRDICVQLPSSQTSTTQQNQLQKPITVRNEVPFRGNETILRIIRQGKPIIVSKKPTVKSVSKQINVHLPKTQTK